MSNAVQAGNAPAHTGHSAVIAGLSETERAALVTRSNLPGLLHLAAHTTAIALSTALILTAGPLAAPAILVSGILLVFLFTPLHESIHGTAFRTSRLNTVVAAVCGVLLFLPSGWFRYFHFAHHRHTHNPDHDPELIAAKPECWRTYLVYLSGIPLWIAQWRAIVLNAAGRKADDFVPKRGQRKVRREARLMLALYAALLAGSIAARSATLVWIWILPVLVGQPFLRAYLLAEHTRCPHVANMFENSRTTFTNAVVRALAWNMPYHAEHHAYPAVPFHKLPHLHHAVARHLGVTETGYTSFHRKFLEEKLKPPRP